MSRYRLSIMDPDGKSGVAAEFESDTPFGAVHVGDLLDLTETRHVDTLLRVTRVAHKLHQDEKRGAIHMIRVFTEAVAESD